MQSEFCRLSFQKYKVKEIEGSGNLGWDGSGLG